MSYMRCPRCGLSVRIRAAYLAVERCPRCIAKARMSVAMTMVEGPADHRPQADRPGARSTPAVGPCTIPSGQQITSANGLAITTRHEADTVVLALEGDLDIASAPLLERHVDDAAVTGSGRVVIDLSGLEFFDCTGLRLLRNTRERLQERRQELCLRRGRQAVQRVFELTLTAGLFQFED